MIEDGNAIIDNLKELSATFKDIYSKGFDIAVQRSDTIFITDMYIENSVKGMERKSRRGEIDRTPKKKKTIWLEEVPQQWWEQGAIDKDAL